MITSYALMERPSSQARRTSKAFSIVGFPKAVHYFLSLNYFLSSIAITLRALIFLYARVATSQLILMIPTSGACQLI